MKPLLVVIGGPTGIGKTATAIQLAQEFGTEIISADSRQFYREMKIGTAVPSVKELSLVKHHFIQHLSITQNYNASAFENDVLNLLTKLFEKYKVIMVAGGSGLYLDAIMNGIDDLPSVPTDVRNKYNLLYQNHGLKNIQELLKEKDPRYFSTVDLNNHKRILKALEIFEITGRPYSQFLKNSHKQRPFDILKIFLDMDRHELYGRINERVNTMVASGLEDEARNLMPFRDLRPLNTVGYKELFEYFDGKITRVEAIEQIKNHSRAYARRQLTWFRRYTGAYWLNPGQYGEMYKLIYNNLL
ncbi:MAG: tRNA (adenosine(37)-N6)-dimethylallyltransferase MiaA [Bacteroidales bacterium]|nr:tRNA (adenosine(37)-N6)-dimethylallyltransferase MiaA [Bacteroidales bacterium]